MRSVAQQHSVRLAPVLDRLAVAQHPHAPGLDALQHAQHFRPLPFEVIPQLAGITLRIPALDVTVGMENRDEIVELAAPQRIMNEVSARPGPEHDVRSPEVARHLILLEDGAVGDVARHARLTVADDALTNL